MLIKRTLNKESSCEISLKLDEKCGRGISHSSQIVFFQFLHCTCFSSAICPLQVPGFIQAVFSSNAQDLFEIMEVSVIIHCGALFTINGYRLFLGEE